jgi:hypothetical protein
VEVIKRDYLRRRGDCVPGTEIVGGRLDCGKYEDAGTAAIRAPFPAGSGLCRWRRGVVRTAGLDMGGLDWSTVRAARQQQRR